MNSKGFQLNGRKAITLLLAALILVLAAAPALAEEDQGEDGYRPAQTQAVMVNDEAMGYISLKDRYSIPVTAETPAFVRVDDDAMGYMSLKGAYIVETPSERQTLAIADDEGMGYLSLKVARLNQVTPGSPALVRTSSIARANSRRNLQPHITGPAKSLLRLSGRSIRDRWVRGNPPVSFVLVALLATRFSDSPLSVHPATGTPQR